jgi:hypothetical protein
MSVKRLIHFELDMLAGLNGQFFIKLSDCEPGI